MLDFLNENYYMLVPALWVIGYGLKQTPRIPDWTIIWILLVVSVAFGTFAFGFSTEGIINGIIAAGVAVLGHQMFKQTINSRRDKKEVIKIEAKIDPRDEKVEEIDINVDENKDKAEDINKSN
nr:phage holin family protein [Mesobacillus maritimus]